SSAEALHVIKQAKKDGVDVTAESCLHYFALSAEDFAEIGAKAKCSPPLRRRSDQEKLWDEFLNGSIDWITSDHSPCTEDLKEGNIFEAWGGISGCQNNIDLLFDLAVNERGLSIETFVDLIAANPAKRFGIQHKGEIALSKDADLIFLDTDSFYT